MNSPTRIACISDLHIDDSKWNNDLLNIIIEFLNVEMVDVVILLGDIGCRLESIESVFQRLSLLGIKKTIYVPGNHDIYIERINGTLISSTEKYEYYLPKLANQYGIEYLENKCVRYGEIDIVGAMGWFDYSFFKEVRSGDQLEKLRFLSMIKNQNIWFEDLKIIDPIEMNIMLHEKQLNTYKSLLMKTPNFNYARVYATHFVPFIESLDIYKGCSNRIGIAFEGSYSYGKAILEQQLSSEAVVLHGHAHNNNVSKAFNGIKLISRVLGGEEDRKYGEVKEEVFNAVTYVKII